MSHDAVLRFVRLFETRRRLFKKKKKKNVARHLLTAYKFASLANDIDTRAYFAASKTKRRSLVERNYPSPPLPARPLESLHTRTRLE